MLKKFRQENLTSEELADLLKELIGVRIASISEDLIVLEDGTRIEIEINEGCGGCYNGWSELSVAKSANLDAAIMNVEYVQDFKSYDKFKIFIYLANNETIELDGDDGDDGIGNGYYGSGFWVTVK